MSVSSTNTWGQVNVNGGVLGIAATLSNMFLSPITMHGGTLDALGGAQGSTTPST